MTSQSPAADDNGHGTVEVQIAVMARNIELLRRREMAPGELDRAGYLILRALRALGDADINGLAAVLGLDSSTAGRQVGALVAEGLAHRRQGTDDRRRAVVEISDEGRRRLALTIRWRTQRVEELLSGWEAEDVEKFGTLLTRYNAVVAQRYTTQAPVVDE